MCPLGGTWAAFQPPAFRDGWGKVRFQTPKQMDNECTRSAPISVVGVCLSEFTDRNVIWSAEQLARQRTNSRFEAARAFLRAQAWQVAKQRPGLKSPSGLPVQCPLPTSQSLP